MKNLKRKIKQGFTLVELVVVIAVIAILSVISIASFANVADDAKKSNDVSALAQLNLGLKIAEGSTGAKPKNVDDALKGLEKYAGISDPEKFLNTTYKNFEFAYNLPTNRFVLLEGNKITEHDSEVSYPNTTVGTEENYWKIVKNVTNNSDYSQYVLAEGKIANKVTIKAGLDLGDYAGLIDIDYVNNERAKTTVLRTHGGTVTIDAKKDTVYHYEFADIINVKAVAGKSFHEHGKVSFFEAASGHIVLEEESNVKNFHFTSNGNDEFKNEETGEGISLDMSKTDNIPSFSRDNVNIDSENGTKVCEVTTSDSEEAVWLWMLGIKEQVKLTDTTVTQVNEETPGIGNRTDDTALLGEEIANNCARGNSNLPISSSTGDELELNENGAFVDQSITSLDDIKPAEGGFVQDKEDVMNDAIIFGGGTGEELSPFRIKSRADFEFIYSHYDSYYYYVVDVESGLWSQNPTAVSASNKVNGTISTDGKAHMDASNWTLKLTEDYEYVTLNNLNGSIDCNGLVIDNLDTWLFTNVGNSLTDETPVTISNLTLNMNFTLDGVSGAAALFRNLGCTNLTLDNIRVSGNIYGNTNTGSFFGYGTANFEYPGADYSVKFVNCYSNATLYDIGNGGVGGFIGHPYPGPNHSGSFSVTNSFYEGVTFCASSNSSRNFAAMNLGTSTLVGTNNNEIPQSRRSILDKATITKSADAITAQVPAEAKIAIVNIFAQMTTYDEQGNAIPDLGGITMVLSATEIKNVSGNTLKLFDGFNSITEGQKEGVRQSAEISDNTLKLKIDPRQSGSVYVKVTFFTENKTALLSTGTLKIAEKLPTVGTNPNTWVWDVK